jgi:hypothetical protein
MLHLTLHETFDTCARCGGTLRIIASIEQPELPVGARAPPVPSTLQRLRGRRLPARLTGKGV